MNQEGQRVYITEIIANSIELLRGKNDGRRDEGDVRTNDFEEAPF